MKFKHPERSHEEKLALAKTWVDYLNALCNGADSDQALETIPMLLNTDGPFYDEEDITCTHEGMACGGSISILSVLGIINGFIGKLPADLVHEFEYDGYIQPVDKDTVDAAIRHNQECEEGEEKFVELVKLAVAG